MTVDLNKLGDKLRKQRNVGVTRDGGLTNVDPGNDGSRENTNATTLKPQRFFV